MKPFVLLFLAVGALASAEPAAPFHRGVNLTEWFQSPDLGQTPVNKFGPQDFADVKSLGADVVRLPVNFIAYVGPAPGYTLQPALLDFLDRAIDGLDAQGLTVVLDNHSDLDAGVVAHLEPFLTALWRQLAAHYWGRLPGLIFELQNEPHDVKPSDWDAIQHRVLAVLRKVEPDRLVVVTGADWGGIAGLETLSVYDDPRLIYSFHFYDPMVFTHQGAGWAKLDGLSGVRFPPRGEAPAAAPAAVPGWYRKALKDYYASNAVATVASSLDRAAAFGQARGVPLWCGELGVYSKVADPAERVEWYRTVRTLLDQRNVPWTTWDYRGAFGLFVPGNGEAFPSDLNVPLVQALGFSVPPPRDPVAPRLSQGFWVYRDLWGDLVPDRVWLPAGAVNFLDENSPGAGRYSLRLTNLPRYGYVGWSLGGQDLSLLRSTGAVTFWARASQPKFSFDLRFVDGPGGDGLPWRLTKTVTQAEVPGDGQWHQVTVPLASMVDSGAWAAGTWHNAKAGSFDWTRVAEFQIVAEDAAFGDLVVGIDELGVRPAKTCSRSSDSAGIPVKSSPSNAAARCSSSSPSASDSGSKSSRIIRAPAPSISTNSTW